MTLYIFLIGLLVLLNLSCIHWFSSWNHMDGVQPQVIANEGGYLYALYSSMATPWIRILLLKRVGVLWTDIAWINLSVCNDVVNNGKF